ncbi:flippase [Inquilinus sp. KBS0705]|nr:flippase [Inquilinus sp. KBS0705]
MSKEKRVLLGNISSLFSVEVANYVLPMISIPVIVRIIGPDKFGLINYAAAVIGYFVLIVDYGFNLTATRKVAQNKDDNAYLEELFSTVLWSKLLFFLFTLIIFLACFAIFPLFKAEWKLMAYSYIILISSVVTTNWLYQGMQELHRVAVFNILVKLIFTISILLIVKQKSDYVYQPLVLGAAQVIIGFYSFRYALRRYNLRVIAIPLKKIITIIKDDRILFFSQVVIYLYTATNTVILGSLADNTQVGFYSAALRFIQIAQSLITLPLSNSFFPYVSTAFGRSKQEGIAAARKVLPIVALISLTAFVGMVTLGPLVLGLFYGAKFQPSIPIFVTLSLVPFLICVSNVYGLHVMLSLKMDKAFFRITTCGCIISICSNFLLVPLYGGLGSGFSLIITESFITIAFIVYLLKQNINIFALADFHPKKIQLLFQSTLSSLKRK